jgi:hypothetical protein
MTGVSANAVGGWVSRIYRPFGDAFYRAPSLLAFSWALRGMQAGHGRSEVGAFVEGRVQATRPRWARGACGLAPRGYVGVVRTETEGTASMCGCVPRKSKPGPVARSPLARVRTRELGSAASTSLASWAAGGGSHNLRRGVTPRSSVRRLRCDARHAGPPAASSPTRRPAPKMSRPVLRVRR